jgi:hypothetical protein
MVSPRRSPPCPAEIIGQLAAKHTGCVLRMRRPGRPAMEYETLLRRLIQERVMERHPQNPQNPQTEGFEGFEGWDECRWCKIRASEHDRSSPRFQAIWQRAAIPTARYAFSICTASKLSRPSPTGRHKVSRAPYAEGRSKSRVGGAVANRRPAALCVCLARFRDGPTGETGPARRTAFRLPVALPRHHA